MFLHHLSLAANGGPNGESSCRSPPWVVTALAICGLEVNSLDFCKAAGGPVALHKCSLDLRLTDERQHGLVVMSIVVKCIIAPSLDTYLFLRFRHSISSLNVGGFICTTSPRPNTRRNNSGFGH